MSQSFVLETLPRRAVVAVVAVLAALVWSHALASVLRVWTPDAPLAAFPLTLAAVSVALVGSLVWPRRSAPLAAAVAGLVAAGILHVVAPGAGLAALSLVPVGAAATFLSAWIADRLPADFDRIAWTRRRTAALWLVLALVAVVQIGRLSTYMTDPEEGFFLTTTNPFWYGHACLPAYLQAAELGLNGVENLYDTAHYPALDPEAAPTTEIVGMHPEDPYVYPPQFLLLPAFALALTHNYAAIHLVWFALQLTLFLGIAAWLALWVGGRAGRVALWSLPVVVAAFPTLHALQFGQFHLAAVVLAVAGYLCFQTERRAAGGALLATAICAKIFPLVLVFPLLAQRRFREIGWTAAFGLGFTALTLGVFGWAPFEAFFTYHLPRLGSGAAFAFDEVWPEIADLVVADNQGIFGLVVKLGALGVAGMTKATAAWVSRLFTIAVLALGFFAGRRVLASDRLVQAAGWLGLLGLASLASPGAWGDYVPVTAVWLLSLVAFRAVESRRAAWLLGITALFQITLLGTMPFGDWAPPALMIPLSLVGLLLMLGLFGWAVLGREATISGAGLDEAVRPEVRANRETQTVLVGAGGAA